MKDPPTFTIPNFFPTLHPHQRSRRETHPHRSQESFQQQQGRGARVAQQTGIASGGATESRVARGEGRRRFPGILLSVLHSMFSFVSVSSYLLPVLHTCSLRIQLLCGDSWARGIYFKLCLACLDNLLRRCNLCQLVIYTSTARVAMAKMRSSENSLQIDLCIPI